MFCFRKITSNFTLLPAVMFLMLSGLSTPKQSNAQEKPAYIGIPLPSPVDPRVPIEEEQTTLGLHMNGSRTPMLRQPRLSISKREAKLDSTGQFINFTETFDDFDFRVPVYMTREDFIETKRINRMRALWLRTSSNRMSEGTRFKSKGGGGLRIDIPIEIRSKTFQKIFGSGSVGLDVTGDISIRGGFRNEKRSEVKTALNRGSDNSFKMEQTQKFNVGGHIGEKVEIRVDQDSEATFDFDNAIHLTYTGDEDEVIKSIEAGNISISLPGTEFVTFGGKSSGLFGIKTSMQLGRLGLTAVASQEKGEKKKLSLAGGASEEAKEIQDYNYKKGTYYFLDESYRGNYLHTDDDGVFITDPNKYIHKIEIYKSAANYQQKYSESIRGWALTPKAGATTAEQITSGTVTPEDTSIVDPEHYLGYFIRLEKTEYYLEDRLGYIRLNVPLQDGEVLAVAYKDTTGNIRGDISFDPNESQTAILRLLKTKTPRPSDTTWDLEWKNVYNLGGRNIPQDGFELRIFYKPPSGDPQETITLADGKTKMTYLQLFGLDNSNQAGASEPDNLVDDNPNIISYGLGELYFPDLKPFDPISPKYKALLPEDKRVPAIYDTTVQSVINAQSNFYLEIKSQTRNSEYRLGMNVIENSEEVTLNGRKLTKDVDYTLDYFTGTLRLLNDEAVAANANLDVTYESNQLFQIDKKTVMGLRAEYALWDDSFIGGTFMYLNERTLDQKIRVGKGPMRNMIWDVNTRMTMKPFFLTRMANFLPFVETRAPSTIKFEGEIAQILPNPNTRNNENTGDNDGVAYIDDFEAAKRVTPIGINRKSWDFSSPPIRDKDGGIPSNALVDRGRLRFYNPYTQVPIKQIWPNRDVNANVANSVNVLIMEFDPVENGIVTESWGGIQKGLSSGYSNQTESKFIEVWVKGDYGVLHIDMGQISEDIIPNNRLNTEDKMVNGIRNGVLDDNEDIGLDGMKGVDPADYWDINLNGIQDDGEPTSWDDWASSNEGANYSKVNGYENNENDGTRLPDSEDMNGNGDVDLRNDYFEYTISLYKDHPDTSYITGKSINNETGEDNEWRQYRIPLLDEEKMTKIGNPDLSLVEYLRIWVDGFKTPGKKYLQITEINLVGSEWKELGIAQNDSSEYELNDDGSSQVSLTVVNTHENPDYKAPPGVQGEVDRITQVVQREQSLVMKIDELPSGYNGIIQKTFYESQDYINYNTMKMFVYGKPEGALTPQIQADSSEVEFFLRFGADMNNYYELRRPVYEGWKNNNIEIDLIELSQIKFATEGVVIDEANQRYVKDKGSGIYLIVQGEPALRNVRMLTAGVKNRSDQPLTGEVWINELRLSNIKKDKGIAMRARMDFALADLVRFNGTIYKKDADFHNVAERFGTGDNQVSGNFSTSISVDKFLPAKLGLSIPVSFNYAHSESTPKYIPGTDVQVTEDLPDTTIEQIMKKDEKRGMSVSFGINSRSQNFVVKNILSKFKASYSRNEGTGSDSRTKYRLSNSESGNMDWGINFSRDNYFRPFVWLGDGMLVRKLSDIKFYYTPTQITTKISGSRNSNESETRTGVPSKNNTFNVNRNFSGGYKIIESLDIDYSRAYTNDLRDFKGDSLIEQFKSLEFGLLTDVNQNFSIKYNPKLFSWLTNNFSYSSGFKYGYNRQQRLSSKSATRNKTLSASGSFNMTTLVRSIYKPTTGGRSSRGGSAPTKRQAPGTKTPGKKGEEDSGPGFSVLGLAAKAFMIFEPFSINISQRSNETVYGISGMPTPAYQFGFSDTLGVPYETISETGSSGTSLNRGSSSKQSSRSLSSGVNFSRNVKLTFKYDESDNLNASTTTTGQRSKSWLLFNDISAPFPDWNIRISGVEKLPFISDYMQRVSIDHSYGGTYNESFNVENGLESISKDDKSSNFRPLIGVTMSMKNGVSMNVKYNTGEKVAKTMGFGVGGTKTTQSDINFTASYSKRSDFRIPLPGLGKMRLKNNVDIALTFSMGDNVTSKSKGAEGEYTVTAETSKWSLKPNVTYSFSNRVRGGAFFEMGKTHNKLIGDSSYKELGLNVNISIRGN